MIESHTQRAELLIQQRRLDEALRELLVALSATPDSPRLHYLLCMVFNGKQEYEKALEHAGKSIQLAPDGDTAHYAMGLTLLHLKRLRPALEAAETAVSLAPEDPENHALKAFVLEARHLWSKALAAADTGLSLDPEHQACLNIRATCLTQLGRQDELKATFGSALRSDPENAVTHANIGWAALHRGDHRGACDAFREALRIDPQLQWARSGIVEALKARNPIYAVMLRYFLWMSRFPPKVQFGLMLGLVFGMRLLSQMGARYPALLPAINIIVPAYLLFAMMTWMARPLFNLLLWMRRDGRLALVDAQKRGAAFFAVGLGFSFLGLLALLLITRLAPGMSWWIYMLPFLLLLPWNLAIQARRGTPRLLTSLFAVAMLGAGIMIFFDPKRFLNIYTMGCILSTWVGNFVPR